MTGQYFYFSWFYILFVIFLIAAFLFKQDPGKQEWKGPPRAQTGQASLTPPPVLP